MGWLLIGKPRKKKKTLAAKRSAVTAPRWDPQRTLLGLKVLGGLGAVLALVAGWHLGYGALQHYIAQTHRQRVTARQVRLADAPSWMSRGVRHELCETVARRVTADPLDGESLRIAAAALDRVAWVRRVRQIHRRADGRIVVQATYRRPLAMVEARDGYYLVGPQGTELVGQPYYRSQLVQLGLPTITGAASAPPARAGGHWTGRGVQAGLKLIRLLSHEPFFGQIESVDVSRHDTRGRLRLLLRTADGGTVFWGFAPGDEDSIEPSVAVKIERLRRMAGAYGGSIDAGGRTVEIYGVAIQARRPVVGGQAAYVKYTSNRP